ncbi:MAG TPA: N-acetylmuramic acid 6-phosphate etherase, partial [Pirellulaceae bacterium]
MPPDSSKIDLGLTGLTTESRNPRSEAIDTLTALEIVDLMNEEDARVAAAVREQARVIATAIDVIAERLRDGGRLLYAGAGTSGRLGVLDATECPPTFNTRPEQVVGLIAGGMAALTRAVEGAEDYPEQGAEDLRSIQVSSRDVVVGIATSGRTPYVVGALEHARTVGAFAIGLACNPDSQLSPRADLMITPIVGPEVISGSTRLKAGTATKLVLNMLTTGAMVRMGKTYGNLMVDLRATNQKLPDRARRIVGLLTGLDVSASQRLLDEAGGELKTAVVMHARSISAEEAHAALSRMQGSLRRAMAAELTAQPTEPVRIHHEDLVIGIDGGGTKTVAVLARRGNGEEEILGRGTTGPSNPQAVGLDRALVAVTESIAEAFADAKIPLGTVSHLCAGIAGSGRPGIRRQLAEYLTRHGW